MLKDHSFVYLIGNKMDLDQQSSTHSLLENNGQAIREVDFDEA